MNPELIGPFDNADAEDGILLNHAYVDMRGVSASEAHDVVLEEAQLLEDVGGAIDDPDRLTELLDELDESFSDLSAFDVGTAGAIYALSAAGAAPISSCNGGTLGESSHTSDVPHILFSADPQQLGPILAAARAANVGLVNNGGHIEVFADCLPKLNQFAGCLLRELEG